MGDIRAGTKKYWDALRPRGERAFHAWGAEQRNALTVLMGKGENPDQIMQLVGKWLEHMGVDDMDEIVHAWDMLLEWGGDKQVRERGAQIFLDSLDSFPVREHLVSSLALAVPGPNRARRAEQGWPLIRQWLDERKDSTNATRIIEVMLDHAVRFACRSENDTGLLAHILADPLFNQTHQTKAVNLWLDHCIWDQTALRPDAAINLMVDIHGPKMLSDQGGTDLLVKTAQAGNIPGCPPIERALYLLLTAGVPFEKFPRDEFPRAWEIMEKHPRVRAHRLSDIANKPDNEARKPRF